LTDPKLSDEERPGWADVVGVLQLRIADEKGTSLVIPNTVFKDSHLLDDPDAPVEAISIGSSHTHGDVVT
jgi:hypothetical protein